MNTTKYITFTKIYTFRQIEYLTMLLTCVRIYFLEPHCTKLEYLTYTKQKNQLYVNKYIVFYVFN